MTNGKLKKIPSINDEFDPNLFLFITKKNILFLLIFIVIALAGSFLYIRYTLPVYQTSAVLQISTEDQAKSIFPTKTYFNDDIAKQVELMRSQVFLKRALERLPLKISYYSKGRFMNFELYRNTPFKVNAKINCSSIYGVPIYIDFVDDKRVIISYDIDDKSYNKREIPAGTSSEFPEMKLDVEILNIKAIDEQQSLFSKNSYFFVINNPGDIVPRYINSLKVNVLSSAAKTVQITYEGNNAHKASDIVNSITEEFSIYELEKKTESANRVLNFIDSQLDLVFDKLSESEIELENFKQKHQIDEIVPSPLPSIQDRINDFENQLVKLGMEESIYREIEKNLKQEEQTDIYKLVAILSGSEFQHNISRMLSGLQELLFEREKLLYEVTPGSRQIAALDHQIDIQKIMIIGSIASLKSNIRSKKDELNNKIDQYEQYILDQRSEYSHIEFSRLQRIHSINERFYNQLIEKKAEHSISKAGFVPQSVILEKSQTPNKPVSPKPRAVYLSSLLAAFFLGSGIILLRYLFYNEISSINDVVKYTNAPVLGMIPRYKKEIPANQLLVLKKPKSLIAESLRSIRTNLQFIDNQPGSKLIAVTSTVSGEGKTFFAMNLAGILAFSNKKVIVIDLDMRRPKIHQSFNVKNIKGISTILSGIDKVSDCIQPSKVKNLDFITAGPVPPNPSELILDKNMNNMIESLKKEYDFIIVDTPPVGIVTDGMNCLLMADYPVYLFKANYSKRMFIQNLNRLIFDNKISRLSLVLNAVGYESSGYGYGKIYSYASPEKLGYKYGYYDDVDDRPTIIKRAFNNLKKVFNI